MKCVELKRIEKCYNKAQNVLSKAGVKFEEMDVAFRIKKLHSKFVNRHIQKVEYLKLIHEQECDRLTKQLDEAKYEARAWRNTAEDMTKRLLKNEKRK